MGLFSIFRKNKQEPVSGDGEFYSRAEEESAVVRGRSKRKDNQSADPVDPVLPEKKRARRRLVGAVALVLAAIVGLPMIFDSEPKPVAEDIAIQIPSKDKSAVKEIAAIPSKPAPAAALNTKEEVAAAPDSSLAGPSVSAAGTAMAVVAAGAGTTTSAAAMKDNSTVKPSEPAKVVEKAAAQPTSKTESKPAAPAEQKSTDAKKAALAAPTPAVSKKASDKKAGKFAVQVAALSTQEKINELLAKLKKAGFTTGTQKVATESGSSTRIRVGPYASKEEAEKAMAKLNKMGLTNSKLVPLSH